MHMPGKSEIILLRKKWVLDGETVMYGSASELKATQEYGLSMEKDFSYKGLTMDKMIHLILLFLFQDCGKSIYLARVIQE